MNTSPLMKVYGLAILSSRAESDYRPMAEMTTAHPLFTTRQLAEEYVLAKGIPYYIITEMDLVDRLSYTE